MPRIRNSTRPPQIAIDRSELRQVATDEIRGLAVTISRSQPLDLLHQVVYDVGGSLVELDDDERVICVYRAQENARRSG